MTTVTLPRKLVEQTIVSLASWLTNSERAQAADALRAALDMSTQSTHPENMYECRCKIDTSQAEQNHLRFGALSNKTDWAAA